MVSIKGKLMVCAQKLRIFMGLPGTRPLSLAEASAHDEHERSMGWRALWFESRTPEWFSLSGHPVAVYRHHKTLGEDHAVLIWKSRGAIDEHRRRCSSRSHPEARTGRRLRPVGALLTTCEPGSGCHDRRLLPVRFQAQDQQDLVCFPRRVSDASRKAEFLSSDSPAT
jgi:hypothetical protein